MHYASWARCARQRQHHHQQEAEGVLEEGSRQSDSGSLSRASSFDGIESAQPSQSAPLLPRADRSSASGGPRREEQQEPPLPSPRHTTLQVTVSSPPEPAGGAPASDAPLLWQPLALPAQKQWAWHDWARYMVYRWAPGLAGGIPGYQYPGIHTDQCNALPAIGQPGSHHPPSCPCPVPCCLLLRAAEQALPGFPAGVRGGVVHAGERPPACRLPGPGPRLFPQQDRAAHQAQQARRPREAAQGCRACSWQDESLGWLQAGRRPHRHEFWLLLSAGIDRLTPPRSLQPLLVAAPVQLPGDAAHARVPGAAAAAAATAPPRPRLQGVQQGSAQGSRAAAGSVQAPAASAWLAHTHPTCALALCMSLRLHLRLRCRPAPGPTSWACSGWTLGRAC